MYGGYSVSNVFALSFQESVQVLLIVAAYMKSLEVNIVTPSFWALASACDPFSPPFFPDTNKSVDLLTLLGNDSAPSCSAMHFALDLFNLSIDPVKTTRKPFQGWSFSTSTSASADPAAVEAATAGAGPETNDEK